MNTMRSINSENSAIPSIPTTLEAYVELYFTEQPPSEMRNRPFDTKNYHQNQSPAEVKAGTPKVAGEYGTNAKTWDIAQLEISLLTPENVTHLHKMMEWILKDITPFLENKGPADLLPPLKSGYIFNAFNQHLAPKLKAAIAAKDKDAVADLTHQAELVRFVADNVANGLSVDESLKNLQEKYQKKVDKMILDGVNNELDKQIGKPANFNPTLAHSQQLTLKQLGIPENVILQKIVFQCNQGKKLIDDQFLTMKKASKKFGINHLNELEKTLNATWSRCTLQLHDEKAADTTNRVTEDFQSLLQFTKDVLSIQRYYENGLGGFGFFSKADAKKEDVINKVNIKMKELLADYPTKKNIGQIHSEMSKFLFDLSKTATTLKSSTPFMQQISHVAEQQQLMAIAARTTSANDKSELYQNKIAQLPKEGKTSVFRR